jgi:hypothetical protein
MHTHPVDGDGLAMTGCATPARYRIRIRGILGDRLLVAFPGLHPRTEQDETVLEGVLPDQAALHGVLATIEALGLELLEVRRSTSRHLPDGHPPRSRRR